MTCLKNNYLLIAFAITAMCLLIFFVAMCSESSRQPIIDGQKVAHNTNIMHCIAVAWESSRSFEKQVPMPLVLNVVVIHKYFGVDSIDVLEDYDAIRSYESGQYVVDAWNNPLVLLRVSSGYSLLSVGPNGQWDHGNGDDIVLKLRGSD